MNKFRVELKRRNMLDQLDSSNVRREEITLIMQPHSYMNHAVACDKVVSRA